MASDTDPQKSTFDGMLDLDEPEPAESANAWADVPEPEWSGDETLLIDVHGHIHVRGGRFFSSRCVGRVRGEESEAKIAALVNRFQELEDRFKALQREIKGPRNLVRNLKSLKSFVHWVEGAEAIGDFAGLLERADQLVKRIESQIDRSRATKLDLVQRAEELNESTAWRATGEVMSEMMEQWKRAGSAGGEEDDALWERFNSARKRFYDRRSEHSAELKRSRNEGRKAKELLIHRAEELAGSTDWQPTFDAMQDLMEQWKQAGSAGRPQDEELWQRFRAAREPFFEARKAHFAAERSRRGPAPGGRGGPRRGRRDGPPRAGGRAGGAPGRTRSSGTLHASLAELVGPLKELFPKDRSQTDRPEPKKKKTGE